MGGFFSSLFHHKSTEVAQPIQNIGAGNLKIGDIRNNKNNAVFKIGSG